MFMQKFKKLVALVTSIGVVLTTTATSVKSYSDVSSSAWFAPYVEALAEA